MTNSINEFSHAGLTVKIVWDPEREATNPRTNGDQLGTIAIYGPSTEGYRLGDEQWGWDFEPMMACSHCDGTGACLAVADPPRRRPRTQAPVDDGAETGDVCSRCDGWGHRSAPILQYVAEHRAAVVALGLRFEDHGSRGCLLWVDEHPDESTNGVIFVSRDVFEREYATDTRRNREAAMRVLRGEVAEYAHWLQGNVFGFVVVDGFGRHLASTWSFIGGPDDEYLLGEARAAAEHCADELERERERVEEWAARGVVTV